MGRRTDTATCALILATLAAAAGSTTPAYQWQTVAWGGGAYVTGLVYHPSVAGLLYARTDTGGAYRLDPGAPTWVPLLDTLPPSDAQLQSVISVALDPSNAQVVYLAAGLTTQAWGRYAAVLRSANRGLTWARVDLPVRLGGGLEAGRAQSGERLQVDPNLGSTLLLGTSSDGLYQSTDAGQTWARLGSFPERSVTFVAFDAASGRRGAATPHLFAGTDTLLYQSTDAGATWKPLPGQPPSDAAFKPIAASVDVQGKLYVTFAEGLGAYDAADGAVFVFANGAWTDVTPAGGCGYGAVRVSARSPDVVAVATSGQWRAGGDEIYRSLNGGRTWAPVRARSAMSVADSGAGPWLEQGGSRVMALALDPFDEAGAGFAVGSGLWLTDDLLCARPRWGFRAAGLRPGRVAALASPATGAQLFLAQAGVNGSNGVDYAHWWPQFLARTADQLAWLSWDNGLSWTPVDARPPGASMVNAGRIAVSASGGTLLWVPGGAIPYASNDNGRTWLPSTGYPKSDANNTGLYFAPVADRFIEGAFYTFDFVRGQLLESTDAGRTFAPVYTGLVTSATASAVQLVAVPAGARELWLVTPSGLYWFRGRTATAPVRIASVQAAFGLGYGAAAPGRAYPTLFLSGRVAGVTGLFRSVDQGATWDRIDAAGQYDADRPDLIAGDQRLFGRVWVAPGGRGVTMGVPAT